MDSRSGLELTRQLISFAYTGDVDDDLPEMELIYFYICACHRP